MTRIAAVTPLPILLLLLTSCAPQNERGEMAEAHEVEDSPLPQSGDATAGGTQPNAVGVGHTVDAAQVSSCTALDVCADCALTLDWSGLGVLHDGTTVAPDDVLSVMFASISMPTQDAIAASCQQNLTQADVGMQTIVADEQLPVDHRLVVEDWPVMQDSSESVVAVALTLRPEGGDVATISFLLVGSGAETTSLLELR